MRNVEYSHNNHLFPRSEDSLVLSDGCRLCCEHGLGFVGRDIVWGNGASRARLMIVGKDSAGEQPSEPLWKASRCTGIPLTNKKTGAKLRILLEKTGVNPFSVFITNTVKCNAGYDDRELKYAKLAAICIQHLRREISIVQPKIIIALGTDAAKSLRKLWHQREILSADDLNATEILNESDYHPFSGAISEITGDFSCGDMIEVFSFKHPSYVEGDREATYSDNLKAIAARLEVTGNGISL